MLGSTVEIRNIQASDDGEYVCLATNDGGNDTLTTTIDVQGLASQINPQ